MLANLGQHLFEPPNVKGWDGGPAWISTNTLLERYNQASLLVLGSSGAKFAATLAPNPNRPMRPGRPISIGR